jgi:phosphoserine aminotransferase
MEKRVYNFSPGPAVLPLSALEAAQRDLLALPGTGISILEISHRSKAFDQIIQQAESNLRTLLGIPSNYQVLFLQGGALLQFGMIPMNFLRGPGRSADYIVTGTWSDKAMSEAKTQGGVRAAWHGKASNFQRLPTQEELALNSNAAYVYLCSNETIQGVQFGDLPQTGDVPLVCDASSDFLCRPLPMDRYGILFACAQKNAGPAGVTVVIIRDDLVKQSPADLPSLLSYKVKLVTDWLLNDIGGLEKMLELNRKKAGLLYDAIDRSNGFYDGHAEPACRSLMNVTFRLPDATLESQFLKEAAQRGLVELKGHRSVGGCRASIYNAMPLEGVELLRQFMLEFSAARG